MADVTELTPGPRRPGSARAPEAAPACSRGSGDPCGRDLPLPETLEDLDARPGTRRLDLDISGLALLGTLLDGAQVMTKNAGALIVGRMGYAAVQPQGCPFRSNRLRPVMRMAAVADRPVTLSAADTVRPPCLSVTCDAGRIVHRVQLMTPADQTVAASVGDAGNTTFPDLHEEPRHQGSTPSPGNVIHLSAVRAARQRWPLSQVGDHLDDFLSERGAARRCLLPSLGQSRARRVRTDLLPSFLAFLDQRRIGVSITVPADACLLQTLTGELHGVDRTQALLSCRTSGGFFSLDMSELWDAWVCRFDRAATGAVSGAMLELYDRDGRGIAALHADPLGNSNQWPEVLEALTTG